MRPSPTGNPPVSTTRPRDARRVASALLFLALALAVAACAEPIDGALLRPGSRLLDDGVLFWMRVDALPESNLPDDAVDVVLSGDAPPESSSTIAPDAWRELKSIRSAAAATLFDVDASTEVHRWRVEAPVRMDAARASITLTHAGRRVPKVGPATTAGLIGEGSLAWWDSESDVLFSFASDTGVLLAFGLAAPRTLTVDVTPATNAALDTYEDRLLGRLEYDDIAERRHTVELDDVSRLCLPIPAGGRMTLPVQRLDGQRLRVAVGLPDVSFDVRDEQLVLAHLRSDGAVCAIEVSTGGEPVRVWEKRIGVEDIGKRFIEEVVDLSEWSGKSFELSLVTEPGPAGDPSFDYVLWSELRVEGAPTGDNERVRPHIVLIDVDTLRADALGSYGATFDTSPRLDAWAASHAEVFEQTTSSSNWTVPATASMLTGLSVHQHGVNGASGVMTPDVPTIATLLRDAGYETRAIAEGACMRPAFGFDVGFEEYRTLPIKRADWREAIGWVEGRQAETPLFVFLQTYLVHAPYEAPDVFAAAADEEYDGWLKDRSIDYGNIIRPHQRGELELSGGDQHHIHRRYLSLVHRADQLVYDFVTQLESILPEPYMVIVTSDHGEEFFEHGAMNHGHTLYEELLRVPLIVKWPKGMAPDRGGPRGVPPLSVGRISHPASLIDIVPTILDVAGLHIPTELPGRSLRTPVPNSRLRVAEHAEGIHSVQLGDYKLVRGAIRRHDRSTAERELYDLAGDPNEQHNLIETRAVVAERLERLLDEYLERWPVLERASASAVDDAALIDELKALGYADG